VGKKKGAKNSTSGFGVNASGSCWVATVAIAVAHSLPGQSGEPLGVGHHRQQHQIRGRAGGHCGISFPGRPLYL